MTELTQDPALDVLYTQSLWVSDSQQRYNSLRDGILEQLKPRDFIEHMWTAEIVHGEWEALGLRQSKSLIVTAARHSAVHNLLSVVAKSHDIDDLAERFFTNKEVRRQVERLLLNSGLSARNIDAEAFRQSLADLAEINRRLNELSSRRDKILQRIEDRRAGLAKPTDLAIKMMEND